MAISEIGKGHPKEDCRKGRGHRDDGAIALEQRFGHWSILKAFDMVEHSPTRSWGGGSDGDPQNLQEVLALQEVPLVVPIAGGCWKHCRGVMGNATHDSFYNKT